VDADRTLVIEAAAGSRDAFDELVRRHQRQIYNLTRALTDGDADAEDLVQETFVRAFRAIPRFRGDSSFRTWLVRIAINVVRTHVDRRSRRVMTVQSAVDGSERERLENIASDEDLETAVGRRRTIDHALAALPEELRTTITLRDIHGLEYHEIATVMSVALGTVESRIFRARQRLRPMLATLMHRPGATPLPLPVPAIREGDAFSLGKRPRRRQRAE